MDPLSAGGLWQYPTVGAGPRYFSFRVVGTDVVIYHGTRRAATLRGAAGRRFLDDVEASDPQQLMARVTGNYKRGNERDARNLPRNRS